MPLDNGLISLIGGTAKCVCGNPKLSPAPAFSNTAASAQAPVNVEVDNVNGTQPVYWGGSQVATSGAKTGGYIATGAKESVPLYAGDDLWLIAAADCSVTVIAGRQ